tara:strand:+ start:670 stop:1038 length:369 start_codon:yes stop_codon:yes gene_type:complete
MYNTEFVCTYKLHEEEDQDDMYRVQLLQAYNLEKWDDKIINNTMTTLFNNYNTNADFKEIIDKAKESEKLSNIKTYIGNDSQTLFNGLFQYDLFDLIHLCMCDLEKSSTISKINKNKLLNNL